MEFRTKKALWPMLSFILVCGGAILGFTVSPWFLLAAAAGAFGPGAARRLGLLHDADEFEIAARDSAAWAAFAATCLAGILLFAYERAGGKAVFSASDAILVVVTLGLVIYGAAYLFRFWNGRKAGRIVLFAAAGGWFLFTLLSEWGHPAGILMETLAVSAPLALLAVLSRFFPRIVGGLCLAASACSLFAFDVIGARGSPNLFVFAALSLPLMVVGIGMIMKEGRRGRPKEES